MVETAARLFDPTSLLLVLLGTAFAAMARSTREDIVAALRALRPLLRARPTADALAARRDLRRIEDECRARGLNGVDRLTLETAFARRVALRLLDATGAESFAAWADEEVGERAVRHEAAQCVWRAAAEAAPAMGMVGTVIGLVGMFAAMEDADRIGASMALAMLTTLYGLIAGPLLAHSIAARLERLSAVEIRWQRAMLSRLAEFAQAEPAMHDIVRTLRAAE